MQNQVPSVLSPLDAADGVIPRRGVIIAHAVGVLHLECAGSTDAWLDQRDAKESVKGAIPAV
jgi:hypothetical protein